MKVAIVGGVAGGSARAPRLRRLDERGEIVMVACGRVDAPPRDREIRGASRSAPRGCDATRVLLRNGFAARDVSGGMLSRALAAAL